jgi:hypothetical protein
LALAAPFLFIRVDWFFHACSNLTIGAAAVFGLRGSISRVQQSYATTCPFCERDRQRKMTNIE